MSNNSNSNQVNFLNFDIELKVKNAINDEDKIIVFKQDYFPKNFEDNEKKRKENRKQGEDKLKDDIRELKKFINEKDALYKNIKFNDMYVPTNFKLEKNKLSSMVFDAVFNKKIAEKMLEERQASDRVDEKKFNKITAEDTVDNLANQLKKSVDEKADEKAGEKAGEKEPFIIKDLINQIPGKKDEINKQFEYIKSWHAIIKNNINVYRNILFKEDDEIIIDRSPFIVTNIKVNEIKYIKGDYEITWKEGNFYGNTISIKFNNNNNDVKIGKWVMCLDIFVGDKSKDSIDDKDKETCNNKREYISKIWSVKKSSLTGVDVDKKKGPEDELKKEVQKLFDEYFINGDKNDDKNDDKKGVTEMQQLYNDYVKEALDSRDTKKKNEKNFNSLNGHMLTNTEHDIFYRNAVSRNNKKDYNRYLILSNLKSEIDKSTDLPSKLNLEEKEEIIDYVVGIVSDINKSRENKAKTYIAKRQTRNRMRARASRDNASNNNNNTRKNRPDKPVYNRAKKPNPAYKRGRKFGKKGGRGPRTIKKKFNIFKKITMKLRSNKFFNF